MMSDTIKSRIAKVLGTYVNASTVRLDVYIYLQKRLRGSTHDDLVYAIESTRKIKLADTRASLKFISIFKDATEDQLRDASEELFVELGSFELRYLREFKPQYLPK